ECLPGPFIVKKCSCPAFGGAQHIRIGKSSRKSYKVYIAEILPSRHQVCHVHILDIKSSEVQAVGKFAVCVDALLADNGRPHSRALAPFRVDPECCKSSIKGGWKRIFQGLLAEIGKTLVGVLHGALQAIELVGGAEPGCPQGIDIEPVVVEGQKPLVRYFADLVKTESFCIKKLGSFCCILHLNQNAGSFCEEKPDRVVSGLRQRDAQAHTRGREAHLQQ